VRRAVASSCCTTSAAPSRFVYALPRPYPQSSHTRLLQTPHPLTQSPYTVTMPVITRSQRYRYKRDRTHARPLCPPNCAPPPPPGRRTREEHAFQKIYLPLHHSSSIAKRRRQIPTTYTLGFIRCPPLLMKRQV